MTTQTYHQASRALLFLAEWELDAGDARKAADRAWQSAELTIKAICAKRGWPRDSDVHLRRAVSRIVEETGDDHIRLLFLAADLCHVNFFDDWYNVAEVTSATKDVRRFIERLEELD